MTGVHRLVLLPHWMNVRVGQPPLELSWPLADEPPALLLVESREPSAPEVAYRRYHRLEPIADVVIDVYAIDEGLTRLAGMPGHGGLNWSTRPPIGISHGRMVSVLTAPAIDQPYPQAAVAAEAALLAAGGRTVSAVW